MLKELESKVLFVIKSSIVIESNTFMQYFELALLEIIYSSVLSMCILQNVVCDRDVKISIYHIEDHFGSFLTDFTFIICLEI